MNRPRTAAALAVAFVLTAAAANWLTARYGFVPVGFGLEATAGTFAAGLALALRDGLQDAAGPRRARLVMCAAIVAGAAVSWGSLRILDALNYGPPPPPGLTINRLALASGAAFLVAEMLDALVYTPLRGRARTGGRRWTVAVGASNVVGAIVDTLAFLTLAFGAAAVTWPALGGQLVGKGWPTLAYLGAGVAVGWAVRRRRAVVREPLVAEGA